MRRAITLAVLLAAAAAWALRSELARYIPASVLTGSAYERYAATLVARDLDETKLGRDWLHAGVAAVAEAPAVRVPFEEEGTFEEGGAAAWRFDARRGQRIVVEVAFAQGRVFADLLECTDGCRPVASAEDGSGRLAHEAGSDGTLVLRIQPELLRAGPYAVSQRAEATLTFPVAGVSPRAVRSTFGADRDGGSRSHEGIDIFAPRGTPVVAAADGLITGATTNRLGGNVVWIWSPSERLALYYAHLERQAVGPGERVAAGEVVGWIGNTGNARRTAPHLHFGIYARPGGAVDPLPYVCDAPCGGSARAISTR